MPIEVTTLCTKEVLLRFSDFFALRKRAMWILMAICSSVVLYLCVYAALIVGWDSMFTWYIVIILLWDGLFVFLNFGLSRITVKKAKNLDARVTYLFDKDQIEINTVGTQYSDHAVVPYSFVSKAIQSKQYLYLMLMWNQGFIVDLSSLTGDQTKQLRQLLKDKLPAKKVTWKA